MYYVAYTDKGITYYLTKNNQFSKRESDAFAWKNKQKAEAAAKTKQKSKKVVNRLKVREIEPQVNLGLKDPMMDSFFDILLQKKQAQYAAISKEDRYVSDILHLIELKDVEDQEGLKYIRLIKESRLKRRKAKDLVDMYNAIEADLKNSQTINSEKLLHRFCERTYTPREAVELFA